MIDESIKTKLSSEKNKLNIKGLLAFMEASGIEYRDRSLRGPLGIATFYCVYLDMDKLLQRHEKFLYFVILHETGHYKHIQKMGGKDAIIKLLSEKDFDVFFKHVIGEEIFADRYASFVFQILNKILYPVEATQQLHLSHCQAQYKHNASLLFGVIDNKEENYKKLLESFVYEV